MSDIIDKVSEIKRRLVQGWELWYVAHRDRLPGHWEMRWRAKTIRVHWDPIVRIQRDPQWFADHTFETEIGESWCYRYNQKAIEFRGTRGPTASPASRSAPCTTR